MRYKCKYPMTVLATRTCSKCGQEFSYRTMKNEQAQLFRTVCDCCVMDNSHLYYRQRYDKQVEQAEYMTRTTAIIIIDWYEGINTHKTMTIDQIAKELNRDPRDIKRFMYAMQKCGYYDRIKKQLEDTKKYMGGCMEFCKTLSEQIIGFGGEGNRVHRKVK